MSAKLSLVAMVLAAITGGPVAHADALGQARRHAQAVTIVRDDWGIAHVHGKTDADADFGMIYAQAEDDFNRVETNYLTALAVTVGGESGDPKSPHFINQVDRYAGGNLREVYFYPDQLNGHTERRYRPGE